MKIYRDQWYIDTWLIIATLRYQVIIISSALAVFFKNCLQKLVSLIVALIFFMFEQIQWEHYREGLVLNFWGWKYSKLWMILVNINIVNA